MYSIDPMIEIALDRQADRVRKVQAVGASQHGGLAASAKPRNYSRSHAMAQPANGSWRVLAVLAVATPIVLWLVWVLVS